MPMAAGPARGGCRPAARRPRRRSAPRHVRSLREAGHSQPRFRRAATFCCEMVTVAFPCVDALLVSCDDALGAVLEARREERAPLRERRVRRKTTGLAQLVTLAPVESAQKKPYSWSGRRTEKSSSTITRAAKRTGRNRRNRKEKTNRIHHRSHTTYTHTKKKENVR